MPFGIVQNLQPMCNLWSSVNLSAYNIVLVLSGKEAYFLMKYLGTTGQIWWFFCQISYTIIHYYSFLSGIFKWFFRWGAIMSNKHILENFLYNVWLYLIQKWNCGVVYNHFCPKIREVPWYYLVWWGGGVLISPSTQIRILSLPLSIKNGWCKGWI